MRILLLSVGRDRKGPTADLVADYIKRCPWRIEIVEIPPCRQGSKSRRLADEATKLRQLIPENAAVIMLDERGDDLESRSLAKRISHYQHEGVSTLCFVIGGADGLDPSLLKQAQLRLAFGRATWPHRLVRAMLAEQIYRASTILSQHPYHRE
jgi:23S rRNA (pseudouridine1915-N3)-methyltransferase